MCFKSFCNGGLCITFAKLLLMKGYTELCKITRDTTQGEFLSKIESLMASPNNNKLDRFKIRII